MDSLTSTDRLVVESQVLSRWRWRALVLGAVLCAGGCSSKVSGQPALPTAEQATIAARTRLRVSLFPWIPSPESFAAWIERDFEEKNRTIDLVVRDFQKANATDLAYDYDSAIAALRGDGDDTQDLVEIDTMVLGQLRRSGVISPFSVDAAFLEFAVQATTIDGVAYGVPHWTCGYFVISEADVRAAATRDALLHLLRALNTSRVDLVGDLDGSWDAVMVYLDALHDRDVSKDMLAALTADTIDADVAADLRAVGAACSRDGASVCADADAAVKVFASGDADALVGYSERLHPILTTANAKVERDRLHIASATLGAGDHPILFTDALVLAKSCANDPVCAEAARRFAEYYVSDIVFESVLLARDADPDAVPRYLLPSTSSAFEYGDVRADRLYQELHGETRHAAAFPNDGVPQARTKGAIRKHVQRALGVDTK
jgi:thiamine pyridinylase